MSERRQISLMLPDELVTWFDCVAGDMGLSRQKLFEMVLTGFRDMQDTIDKPGTLFHEMTKNVAEGLIKDLQQTVKKTK